jgi:hypothetical protein
MPGRLLRVSIDSDADSRRHRLQTEPWLFVFDASGRISTRIEGAFSVADLEAAIEKAQGDA